MRRARMGGGYSDAHAILAEETAMPVRFNTASAGADPHMRIYGPFARTTTG